MKQKVVLVTGMHRSGTSVMAQWLHRCGLHMGDRLVGAGIGNEDGHFEDEDFLHLHEDLLRNHNLPATGFTDNAIMPLTESDTAQLAGVVYNKCRQYNQWGWKEPRTCLFLNAYGKLLPQAFYFVVVRNYNDTINSLVTREYKIQEEKINNKKGIHKLKWNWLKRKSMQQMLQLHAENFLRVWINYYEHTLTHIVFVPPERVLVISCPQLLYRDKAIFSKLTQGWGLQLDYTAFAAIFKQQYISEPHTIDAYVNDKTLLSKARAIEEKLLLKYGVSL